MTTRKSLVVLTLALAIAAAAFLVVQQRAGGDRARIEPLADRNILLVTIDTLRADALGSYGGRAVTPYLDALAAGGARFDFAHAHAVVPALARQHPQRPLPLRARDSR